MSTELEEVIRRWASVSGAVDDAAAEIVGAILDNPLTARDRVMELKQLALREHNEPLFQELTEAILEALPIAVDEEEATYSGAFREIREALQG